MGLRGLGLASIIAAGFAAAGAVGLSNKTNAPAQPHETANTKSQASSKENAGQKVAAEKKRKSNRSRTVVRRARKARHGKRATYKNWKNTGKSNGVTLKAHKRRGRS